MNKQNTLSRVGVHAAVLLFLFFSVTSTLYAQRPKSALKLSEGEWSLLFSALDQENWKEAFDLSSKYLDQLKNDDNAESVANLRYILIFSAAGSVSVGKLSYDDLDKQLPKVAGKSITTPFHPLGINCRPPMFNYICKTSEGEYDVSTTTSNQLATSILSFEYVKLRKQFPFEKHEGEFAAVMGTIDKVVPNPNRSKLLILRIYIKDAEIVPRSEINPKLKV